MAQQDLPKTPKSGEAEKDPRERKACEPAACRINIAMAVTAVRRAPPEAGEPVQSQSLGGTNRQINEKGNHRKPNEKAQLFGHGEEEH